MMGKALDDHMFAIVDNGFIPEGMPQEGYWDSRDAAAYPLARLMALGAKAGVRDRANVTSFIAAHGSEPDRPTLGGAGSADARQGRRAARARRSNDDEERRGGAEPRGRGRSPCHDRAVA